MDSYEIQRSCGIKVVEEVTAEINREKEELLKQYQESISVIETLKNENVSHPSPFYLNLHLSSRPKRRDTKNA